MIENIKILKNNPLCGKFINLRIAEEKDAEFILSLRLNPNLNKFLGETNPSVVLQRSWIKNSFENEHDFHFIIEDKKGIAFGTIAIYDIDYVLQKAEWGRLIIKQNSPFYFPVEATIILLDFAFNTLKMKSLYGGANNKNTPVVEFHKTYADISSIDEVTTWFTFEEKNLEKIKKRFKNLHNK